MTAWDFKVRWEKSAEIKQDWMKVKRTQVISSISNASFGICIIENWVLQ